MQTNTRPLALVTGASTGIGYELAKKCAEHGFDLWLLPRSAIPALRPAHSGSLGRPSRGRADTIGRRSRRRPSQPGVIDWNDPAAGRR